LLQTLTALSGVSLLLTAALLAATLGYGTTQQAPALMQFFELVAIGLVGWLWLAGGLVLARALAVEADVMLMDEPLANLDPPHQADWLQLVRGLVAGGKTVVSVLHEIGMALHADEVIVLDQGQVLHHGACSDLATHAAIEAVFNHRIRIYALDGQWVVLPRIA
jgi:ABC-type arginine transport system ATPase subunit